MDHRGNLFFDYLFSRCSSLDQYVAVVQNDVSDFKTLLESQWSVPVEPYSKFIRAADAQSSKKLVVFFEGLQPWMSDFIHAWNVFIGLVEALGCGKVVIPGDVDALEGE